MKRPLSFSERPRREPGRDVQAQVLHPEEDRLHRQALLLRHRGGGEVGELAPPPARTLTRTERAPRMTLKMLPPAASTVRG